MFLPDLLVELTSPTVAYLSRVTGGRLWCLLEHLVEKNGEEVDLDLQLDLIEGDAAIMVRAVRGEALLSENTVALGEVRDLPQRAQVIVELWRLSQDGRVRARWLAGVERKMAKLGICSR